MFLKTTSTAKADPQKVRNLYHAVTEVARTPVFYTRFAVPDTTDGRYDMLCLSLALYLFRIQQAAPETAQALFDLAFQDVELGLREAGVGDLSVSKHMKKMLEAFYGRAALYYEALEQQDTASLSAVITRNLYSGDLDAPAGSMAEWVRIAWSYLQQIQVEELLNDPQQMLHILPPERQTEAA